MKTLNALALAFALFGSLPAAASSLRGRSVAVTPTITADAYAQGDQMGTYTRVAGLLGDTSGAVDLKSLVIVDNAKVKHDLQVLFFNAQPTLASADNAAVSFTDAVATASFLGRVAVAEANYVDTASNSQVTATPGLLLPGAGAAADLWMVLVCVDSGGCDYAAVDDLTLRFNVLEYRD